MVIGIPIPIILPYFFTPSKTCPSDLDFERKRHGPQPPKPPPDAWSGDHASFVFLKSKSSCIAGTSAGIFVISVAQTSSPGGGACLLT
ncbi:hypothetical protein [Rhizobium leguminosarum]|uniref:hypothetical protein n=1 Tax=Rhizobium leguminosarum TaxID=384 RepID=UPI003F99510D